MPLGLGVHGWICSGIDSWQRDLGLLHCGCWVVPLRLSSVLLWGGDSSPSNGPHGVPVLWGAFGCLLLRCPLCLSQVCGSSHLLLHIFIEEPYILKRTYTHRCLDSGVNRYTDVLY
ncbi:hypothetical protein CHARACLAT_017489 [Characodon lateralis]|uniref:Uncharacterized protein n=1 Tax=Characodon lateralis TaxID=208331 RepID=A0ABU7EVX7_9TELE|nr:hypothetical protein [Characodon lateralis]